MVTPKVEPGYEWVFEDEGVKAVDKLHGTNVCVIIKDGIVQAIHNRTQVLMKSPHIDINISGQSQRAMQGIINGMKHLKNKEGRIYGELIGPKINGNIHKLDYHTFVPFDYLKSKCHWKSWIRNDYPKTFIHISDWFQHGLFSLYSQLHGNKEFAEGLVFYHPDGRKAKLRRDMFDWYHKAKDVS